VRKKLWLALFAFLISSFAPSAQAQGGFTTVTGTITGAIDGIVWSCGTISAQLVTAGGVSPTLNGGGFSTSTSPIALGCPTTNGLPAGSFSMRLADSGVIVPGTTTWQFTVSMAPGIAPPAGTGAQSFTYTTAINCSTNTPSTCTANTMSISAQLSALAPKLSNAAGGTGTGFPVSTSVNVNSGGNININTGGAITVNNGGSISATGTGTITATNGTTSVTTLPGSATAGSSFLLPNGAVVTSQGGSVYTGGLEHAISPAANGVKMDAQLCRDTNAQFTTTTSVTCLTAVFTSADLTKAEFGACCGIQGGLSHVTSSIQMPQGTITVINSTTNVTVSLAGTGTACAGGAANCSWVWGTDDSAAWDATWTAATGTAGHCYPIQMGGGMTFISTAKFLTTVCNTGITGTGSQGSAIFGLGYKASMFVVLPNIVAAGCTGTAVSGGNVVCFGPSKGFQLFNVGIWGGENGTSTQLNGKIFINCGVDCYMSNVLLAGFATSASSTMIGWQTEFSGQTFNTVIVDGFGAGSGGTTGECNVAGGTYNRFVQVFCGDTAGIALAINGAAGTTLGSSQSFYGATSTTQSDVAVFAGNIFNSSQDQIFDTGSGGGANILLTGAGAIVNLNNDTLTNTTSTSDVGIFFQAATQVVSLQNTTIQGGAANSDIEATSAAVMGTLKDLGNNTYVTGIQNTAAVLGKYIPFRSVTGSCTGTTLAAGGTFGLYGTGPNITSTTCAGLTAATVGSGIVMDHSGNVSILMVSASNAGSGVGSGVVTVNKNGAGTTITCTIGTGTSCSDVTHTVAFVAGDLITIQFTSAVSDTLAGVKAAVSAY
jgi:fibronectin-binding autotransporter adhesin